LVTTGDNVSSFQKSRYGDKSIENQRGKRFFEIIKQVNTNYLIALGNHDYKIDSDRDSDDPFSKAEIDTMEILWEKIAGLEPYRSFEYKGWNMIMLNSMRGRYLDRFFDDQQMTWFENELEKDMPSLVFFHHPIETDHAKNLNLPTDIISPEQEKAFYKIIADNKNTIKGIFAGHIHRWHKDTIFEEIPFFVTDSFADNERSPYTLITVDTLSKLIYVEQNELLDN
jgi:hypothetical protein